jgi:enoyl-CoA hydratase/carnithine racemase
MSDTAENRSVVHLAIDAGVATITLDSPGNRNALSRRLVGDLLGALDGAKSGVDDGSVRSIVLTHTPPVFCAGADLKERVRELACSTERASSPQGSGSIVEALATLMDIGVPTIAAVSGPVRAGGIGLMAACDLVVVRRDVVFALAEVRIGVAAAIISVPIFRRASPSRLAAAFLTGEPFSAEEARQAGLVTHVTDDVTTVVDSLCDGVAKGAPGALAATKRLLRDAYDTSPDDRDAAFERMRALSDALFSGDEAAEGMAAFAEKRPPAWQNTR